jgi:hypothetical protein
VDATTSNAELSRCVPCSFDQPIEQWNVESVLDMHGMFYHAKAFNQPIGNWKMGAVLNLEGMLECATAFRQPLAAWRSVATPCGCPFALTADGVRIADMDITFCLSTTAGPPMQQWLRVHDMVLTLQDVAAHAHWLRTLPEDVVWEWSRWIGIPMRVFQ